MVKNARRMMRLRFRPGSALPGRSCPASLATATDSNLEILAGAGRIHRFSGTTAIPRLVSQATKMKIIDMVLAVQKKLGIEADGRPGPQTWGAIYQYIVRPEAQPTIAFTGSKDKANERSEKAIATLLPDVKPYARALFFKARDKGIAINIISGTRTFEEQNRLYAKGRTTPGPKVTNARGGYSNHNFGIAFDIGVFNGNRYLPESPLYKAVGALGMELGLGWGGNWKSIVDQPHFELRPAWAAGMSERDMLAELRSRTEHGERIA